MFTSFLSHLLFFSAFFLVFLLPGYFLLLAALGKSKTISAIERLVLSVGLSIISIDFIFFAFTKLNLVINRSSALLGIAIFILSCLFVFQIKRQYANKTDEPHGEIEITEKLFDFSKNQTRLILLLLLGIVFLKTAYLSNTVYPTATDMGHHMYWAKWMVENKTLPTYDGMPDFIIGEHVVFGILATITGASFFSAFPIIVLFFINLIGILAVFVLALRIFKKKNVAILSLLFLGVFYAITSPQAKFVSGGVVGNIFGNLFLPLTFYLYYRSFSFLEQFHAPTKENSLFLALAIFSTFGLFYTHHLSAFIFLFIIALFLILFIVLNFFQLKNIFLITRKIAFSPQVIGTFLLGIVFFFFVFTPTYISGTAVDTAVGAPSKETRAGFTIAELRSSIGEARIALGLIGLAILTYFIKKNSIGKILVFSWATMILLMSTMPKLLFINLPSNRVANYLSYPFAILSAYAVYIIFTSIRLRKTNYTLGLLVMSISIFIFMDGLGDFAKSFKNREDLSPVAQTFNASHYLQRNTTADDVILKDHNYITADAWIKLFLMQGYKYPLSRGYFKRYEDATKPREMCSLQMISSPTTDDAQVCFQETGTNFIMINPIYDSTQFKKLSDFNQIYASSQITIYHKK
jgi:hypothetical protein